MTCLEFEQVLVRLQMLIRFESRKKGNQAFHSKRIGSLGTLTGKMFKRGHTFGFSFHSELVSGFVRRLKISWTVKMQCDESVKNSEK